MKGEITKHILEAVLETPGAIADYIGAFLGAGYGVSMGKLDYEFSKRRREREKNHTLEEETKRRIHRYHLMFSKLKRQGLIVEVSRGRRNVLSITAKGKRALERLCDQVKNQLPLPQYQSGSASDRPIIVSFDIPEKERRKRDWLRLALRNLGLAMVQRSVWVGNTKIPAAFIKDLEKLRIFDFVEIFEVTKSGNLRQVE